MIKTIMLTVIYLRHFWQANYYNKQIQRFTCLSFLGIIPPQDNDSPTPCWEKSTDIFPKPSGNMTDTEKLSTRSGCSIRRCQNRHTQPDSDSCSERTFDRLYLRATANAKTKVIRETLLIVDSDFERESSKTLSVNKGEVVTLLGTHANGWFWVRSKAGEEGFIPAAIVGHGFL